MEFCVRADFAQIKARLYNNNFPFNLIFLTRNIGIILKSDAKFKILNNKSSILLPGSEALHLSIAQWNEDKNKIMIWHNDISAARHFIC